MIGKFFGGTATVVSWLIIVGGDVDGASKTLIGIATDPEQLERTSFLIAVSPYVTLAACLFVRSGIQTMTQQDTSRVWFKVGAMTL